MQASEKKIWYASSMRPYPENEPWYYNSKDFPALLEIEKNWSELKIEINSFIKEKDNKFLSSKPLYEKIDLNNGWSAIMFMFWGLKISSDFKKKCPKTSDYLNKVHGLVSLSFSQLAPESTLAEHTGDTNAILRCHLGVEIPGELPECGLKVNGESKSWEEGKWLIFNDAYKHEAWNNTSSRRIIIIMDFIKPEFVRKKNTISAFIITRHISYIYHKVNFIAGMPVFIKTILFAFFLGMIYIFRPLYNLFK
jgi:ornithine lipid ester-linked acyl 2-hydroxylase